EQATTAVQTAYFARVALHVGHRGFSVSPHHFGTALSDLDAAVQTALMASSDTAIPLTPTLDTKLIAKWVKTLPQKTDRAPVAGQVTLGRGRPFFPQARLGRALRPTATGMLIGDAIVSGTRTVIAAPLGKIDAASATPGGVIVTPRAANRLYLYHGTRLV